jgi:hypothetical protein
MDYLRLTWKDIERQSRYLAERIKEENVRFDMIVGMARGGLVPARLLSDMLDNDEVYTVRVKFYESVGKTAEKPLVIHHTQFDVAGKNVLLVDDIADTGGSLLATIEHLKENNVGSIFVVTLVKKPTSKFIPDLFAEETSAWVIFPWEVQETLRDIFKKFGKGKDGIKELKNAGISEEELKSFIGVQ